MLLHPARAHGKEGPGQRSKLGCKKGPTCSKNVCLSLSLSFGLPLSVPTRMRKHLRVFPRFPGFESQEDQVTHKTEAPEPKRNSEGFPPLNSPLFQSCWCAMLASGWCTCTEQLNNAAVLTQGRYRKVIAHGQPTFFYFICWCIMWLLARAFLSFAAGSLVLASEQRERHERPHILFLMVDEMDGRLLDDETPQFKPPLPNLRALMTRGAYFPNTYSNSPLCVPARTSMVTGRYNSDIKIWDNFVGIANVNGDDTQIDNFCLAAYSRRECLEFAAAQKINGTFFDVLADQGYNLTLWGKVHAGGGVERFSRHIFNDPFTGTGLVRESAKAWTRSTGVSSKSQDPTDWLQRPIDVPKPAENFFDYPTAEECTRLLKQGLFKSSTPQFLYCSFAVPHPPYQTNSTYWNAVGPLGKHAIPPLVPRNKLHPADEYAVKSKQFWNLDNCSAEHIEHFRRVYFAMCVEADHLVGRILSAFWENVDPDDAYVIFVSRLQTCP